MTEWTGRSAAEILADGVGTPAQVYVWRRARGESQEVALPQVIRQSGYSSEHNIAQLTKRCLAAEAREQERATTPKPAADTFHTEALAYVALRSGQKLSRRDAVDEVAKRFGHRTVNRPALEKRLAEIERERFPRPEVDIAAVANDATNRLAVLEETRVRLAPDALVDGEVMAELEQVEHEIRSCKRTLELVSLARTARVEEKAAA